QTGAIITHSSRALRIVRLVKLLSLLRLLRISRLVRYVSQWEEVSYVSGRDFLNIASKFLGILNLVCLMLLLGHWNACLQFLVPNIKGHQLDSWTKKCHIENSEWFTQYTWALFKAMSHMLSIGYGRFPPTQMEEAWVTIGSMMTGATCYALFFKQVEEYMAYRKLPRSLRQRIANYYEHRYQGKMFNENAILDELSECLREQIINYNCRALVAAVPFFTYADQEFVSEVVVKLRYEVFQPGDLVIKEGTLGSKMYFIQEGIVDIITKDGEVATSLSDGSYFGEICLLTNARRVASVRAETYCNVYSLDRSSFLEVLDNYPLMRRTMESVAAERLNKLGQDPLLVSNRKDLRDDLKLVKEIVNEATPITSDSGSDKSQDSTSNGSDHGGSRSSLSRKLKKKRWRRRWDEHITNSVIDTRPGHPTENRRRSVVQLVQKIGLRKLRNSTSALSDLPLKFPNLTSGPKVIVTPAGHEAVTAMPRSSTSEMYEIIEDEAAENYENGGSIQLAIGNKRKINFHAVESINEADTNSNGSSPGVITETSPSNV
ncbi:anaphase-promoting complex subunit Hcn1, partial [Cichlidogyrus casuarinus]